MDQPSEMELKKYKGQRYVRLVRVSDAGDKQASDAAQLDYLKNWADQRLMVHVDDYVENDLSGSLPGNRHDLAKILKDAEENKNFRYVIAQRIDRATRGGADHLFWLEFELKKKGVRIIYPGDGLPEGIPFEHTLRAAKADAAKETAMSTSQRTAQGSQFALEARRVSPHSRTPLGCYRLYCRPDRTPLYLIADKRDGRQEKRSWPGLALIDTYGTIGGGSVGHYRKQKSELVYLVPGDPFEVETVKIIFQLRFLERKSSRKIAQHLNASGRPAPRGGKWGARQVESIYENEDYTGRAVANRKSSARYNRRDKRAPQRVELDDKTSTTADRIPPILRPQEEWFEDKEPYMLDFLGDRNLRDTAEAYQRKYWERRLDPTRPGKNQKKHVLGPYLLHPLLVAKQDGEALVGSMSGKAHKPVRTYRHKRAVREPQKGSIYGRVFNAKVLEQAVLEVLQEILRGWDELEPRLLAHVRHHLQSREGDDDLLVTKRQRREEVRDQLLLYVRTLTTKTQADLAPEIARLEAQRDALDCEIEGLDRRRHNINLDENEIAATLKGKLEHLADEVNQLPAPALSDVLFALTAKLAADMETKEVEFAFHLPSWMALNGSKNGLSELCTGLSSGLSTWPHTQRDDHLYLALGNGVCNFSYPQHQAVECNCTRRQARAA